MTATEMATGMATAELTQPKGHGWEFVGQSLEEALGDDDARPGYLSAGSHPPAHEYRLRLRAGREAEAGENARPLNARLFRAFLA